MAGEAPIQPSDLDQLKEAVEDAPPATKALVFYALITLSVVLAGADGYDPFQLAGVVVGQALSLTLAHAYAESVAHQTSLWAGVQHASPVLYVAIPSFLITLVAGLLGTDGETAVLFAELANLAGLVGLQALSARRTGLTRGALFGALLLDVVAITTVVLTIALLK